MSPGISFLTVYIVPWVLDIVCKMIISQVLNIENKVIISWVLNIICKMIISRVLDICTFPVVGFTCVDIHTLDFWRQQDVGAIHSYFTWCRLFLVTSFLENNDYSTFYLDKTFDKKKLNETDHYGCIQIRPSRTGHIYCECFKLFSLLNVSCFCSRK